MEIKEFKITDTGKRRLKVIITENPKISGSIQLGFELFNVNYPLCHADLIKINDPPFNISLIQ